jgi:hypothetical protein
MADGNVNSIILKASIPRRRNMKHKYTCVQISSRNGSYFFPDILCITAVGNFEKLNIKTKRKKTGLGDSVVGRGTMLQVRRLQVRFSMRSLDFFYLPTNPSSRIMALVLTQPLTKLTTRNLPWIGDGEGGGHVRFTISLPSVSRLSRK